MDIREVDLCLRELTECDIPKIVEIEHELFSDPWSPDIFLEELNNKDLFYKEINGERVSCKHNYLLEYQGEIVGFFLGWAVHDEYSIMNIGVSKNYQKLGFGSYLMHKLIEKAIESKCFVVYLEVRESNLPAIKLYEKFNFEKIGLRKNYYQNPQENGILMRLDLDVSGDKMDGLLAEILGI